MAISILTNLPALNATNNLDTVTDAYNKSLQRLSTGQRITSVSDDPSGAARVSGLTVQVSAIGQAKQNVQNANSIINVAEGGLNEVNNLLVRLRELSVAAASEEIAPGERDSIALEGNSILSEIDRLAQATKFFGHPLLNGEGKPMEFQVGPNNSEFDRVTFTGGMNATTSGLGVSSLNLYSPDDALGSMDDIDQALQKVRGMRSQTGAFSARLNSIENSLNASGEGVMHALSLTRDTDYAKESTQSLALDVRRRSLIAVLSHANLDGQAALKLLGGS